MLIQWYPGHMTKAIRQMENDVKLCDGVIIVLDARVPYACINKNMKKIIGNKPVVYVFNKIDLADRNKLNVTLKKFDEQGKICVLSNGTSKKDIDSIYQKCLLVTKEKIEKDSKRGMTRAVRFMVAGIPNTGKSTIINTFSGGKKAITGDKAGVTKGNQWIRLGSIDLLDTPGTMPPSFDNQVYARHLAYIGSINDDILDKEELVFELIKELIDLYPNLLKEKYNLTELDKPVIDIFNDVCKNRGFLMRGGEFDYSRCAVAVLDDLRKGRIGKISFE